MQKFLHDITVKFFEYSSGLLIAKSQTSTTPNPVVNATIAIGKTNLIPKTAISIPTVRNIFSKIHSSLLILRH